MTKADTIIRETPGDLLREWRKRRRMSQLELALLLGERKISVWHPLQHDCRRDDHDARMP